MYKLGGILAHLVEILVPQRLGIAAARIGDPPSRHRNTCVPAVAQRDLGPHGALVHLGDLRMSLFNK